MATQESLQQKGWLASFKNFFRRKESPPISEFDIVMGKIGLRDHYDLLKGDYLELGTDCSVIPVEGGTQYNLFLYFHREYQGMGFEESRVARQKAKGVHVRMTEGTTKTTEVFFTDGKGWSVLSGEELSAKGRAKLIGMVNSARLKAVEVPFDSEKGTIIID